MNHEQGILKLGEKAYGVAIRERLCRETGHQWSFGSIYMPLNKLTRKEFVNKAYSEPTPERGGRRKCIYRPTEKGLEALREIQRVQDAVWTDLPSGIL